MGQPLCPLGRGWTLTLTSGHLSSAARWELREFASLSALGRKGCGPSPSRYLRYSPPPRTIPGVPRRLQFCSSPQ